jgi:diguanylate cyclase (GGDEF)-like protein
VLVVALTCSVLAIYLASTQAPERPAAIPPNDIVLLSEDLQIQGPSDVVRHLRNNQVGIRFNATNQPNDSFWLYFPVRTSGENLRTIVELRMLRASALEFWQIDDGMRATSIRAENSKGGLAVHLAPTAEKIVYVVGHVSPIGVSRPKAFLWSSDAFTKSSALFDRAGGSLIGVFVVLAFLSLVISAFNRDWAFFLFAGWLITSLRIASVNDGWDLYWLGVTPDPDFLLIILRTTLAAHPLLTLTLFGALLHDELKKIGLIKYINVATFIFLGIFLCSPFSEHSTLLPVIWGGSALGMLMMLGSLAMVVYKTRSAVSIWYSFSWLITFSGYFLELGYASGLISVVLPGVNTQTTSMASAVVTTIALAERLRTEKVERLTAQKERGVALSRLKANYDAMPLGLFSLLPSGYVALGNPFFTSMFRVDESKLSRNELHIDELLCPGAFEKLSHAAMQGEEDLEIQVPESKGNAEHWYLARVTSKGGAVEGSIQDITLRKQAEARLRHLVDHDSLTGLRNRRGLEEAMEEAENLVADGVPCAIAQLSLDRFKLINDLYGHRVGDVMLQQTALRLMQAVRGRDHVARIADSFVVIFLDCPDFATVGLSERLREAVSEMPFELEGKRLDMTASVGVVGFDPKMDLVDTLAAAGRACAEAKSRGRNCVVQLDDNDSRLKAHLEELKVVADLKRKIHTDRYFLDFQPIVALQAPHSSLNYEVLLRMRDENGGVIQPGRFIGAAERNGLMSEIDRWVLRSTLEWLDQHAAHRDRLSFATINISGASLNDARFVDDAFAMIADHPMAMPKLCFEITESVALNDINSTRRFIDRVKQYGSKLALDDFGAGYTSFNYLKEIPADFIKIDGSFVRDINLNPANYSITRTIVDLTHELGMRSIAEWAETPDTVATLVELGVDYGQGYGLARAMDKNLVTAAASCGELVRDERVLAIMAAGPAYAGVTAAGGAAVR